MPKVSVVGTTSWGITLAIILARKGLQVDLWTRTEKEAVDLKNTGFRSSNLPQPRGFCKRHRASRVQKEIVLLPVKGKGQDDGTRRAEEL